MVSTAARTGVAWLAVGRVKKRMPEMDPTMAERTRRRLRQKAVHQRLFLETIHEHIQLSAKGPMVMMHSACRATAIDFVYMLYGQLPDTRGL
jgi:hypothetical protein